jgi:hypothetical protein
LRRIVLMSFSKRTGFFAGPSVALVLGLSFVGCRRETAPAVEVSLPSGTFRFVPESAFAEYVELKGQPDQLRITLASYRTSCDSYVAPEVGQAMVSIVVKVPTGDTIKPGEYPWRGTDEDPVDVQSPFSLPFVRLHNDARALASGGGLRLESMERRPHGKVVGSFAYQETDRDSEQAFTGMGLRGNFSLRLCRVLLDSARTQAND